MDGDLETFRETLIGGLRAMRVSASADQIEKMAAHYQAMVQQNQVMNLTRIVKPAEAAIKHYVDSLALLRLLMGGKVRSVADIGTGAGFPAVPLSICRPEWRVAAVDARRKKVDFVSRIASELSLDNLKAVHERAEHWHPRSPFDAVLCRAVSPLEKCLQTAAHLVGRGGYLVVYKTVHMAVEEVDCASQVAREKGFEPQEPYTYTINSDGEALSRILVGYQRG